MTTRTQPPQWELCHYGIRAPDDTEFFMLNSDGRQKLVDYLNAQQQRIEAAERERDVAIAQSVEWFQKAEQGYRFVTAATERIEALEAALRELNRWTLHGDNEGAVCGACGNHGGAHHPECPTRAASALLSASEAI